MLEAPVRTLCRGVNLAALTTLFSDGTPQYLDLDGYPNDIDSERVILEIAAHRQVLIDAG